MKKFFFVYFGFFIFHLVNKILTKLTFLPFYGIIETTLKGICMDELRIIDKTPRWIFQAKSLRKTERWQRDCALPASVRGYEAFFGMKAIRTTSRFECPDYLDPSHFCSELVYLPCPGPINEYDEEEKLVDIGTLAKVDGELKYVGFRMHYFPKSESGVSMALWEYDAKGNLTKEVLFDQKMEMHRERRWNKHGLLMVQKDYLGGKLFNYRFLSPQGEVYKLWWNGKPTNENKALVRDNIMAKKADRKRRAEWLKLIREERNQKNARQAQHFRKEFNSLSSLGRKRPFLSRLLKKRAREID